MVVVLLAMAAPLGCCCCSARLPPHRSSSPWPGRTHLAPPPAMASDASCSSFSPWPRSHPSHLPPCLLRRGTSCSCLPPPLGEVEKLLVGLFAFVMVTIAVSKIRGRKLRMPQGPSLCPSSGTGYRSTTTSTTATSPRWPARGVQRRARERRISRSRTRRSSHWG